MRKDTVWLFVDECHVLWGDAVGYVWGPRGQRVELPITNERVRQTYYGALNLLTGRALTFPAVTGNGEQTIAFLSHLRWRFQGRRIVIVWDRASYHCSEVVKAYLTRLNGERPEEARRIHLLQFAPHAPEQNPMEDVWLAAKNHVRRMWYALNAFADVKWYFTTFIDSHRFEFEKLNWYGRLQLV